MLASYRRDSVVIVVGGRQSLRTFSTILTMFCTNFSRTKLIIPTILDLVVNLSQ